MDVQKLFDVKVSRIVAQNLAAHTPFFQLSIINAKQAIRAK